MWRGKREGEGRGGGGKGRREGEREREEGREREKRVRCCPLFKVDTLNGEEGERSLPFRGGKNKAQLLTLDLPFKSYSCGNRSFKVNSKCTPIAFSFLICLRHSCISYEKLLPTHTTAHFAGSRPPSLSHPIPPLSLSRLSPLTQPLLTARVPLSSVISSDH